MLLEIRNLSAFYMGPDRLALNGVNLTAKEGEIVGILGPNGAGKSTVLKAIFREVHVQEGEILFQDENISSYPPHKLAPLGIAFVPEGRRLFGSMTVEENLDMGGFILKDARELRDNKDRVFEIFPSLTSCRKKIVKKLSGGEQQMVAFGRAMMLNPRLLLMDEPSLGLSPQMVEKVFEMIRTMNGLGLSILLVEQNVNKALEVAHKAYVLDLGQVAFVGSPFDIQGSEDLKRMYLGG
jgi:branched-chain amino acid transport system ATP-binding protein